MTSKSRLKPIPWSDLHLLPKRKPLVKGLLDNAAMSVVFGESNCGKTFIALDLAACIATGREWHGRKLIQGTVLYIAAEGGLGLEERLTAFRHHHQMEGYAPLFVIPAGIDLCRSKDDIKELLKEIKGLGNISLVVIDTLSRAMAGGNENSSEDMGAFIQRCDKIREIIQAHVMILHHSGKDKASGARGHSALRAAVDTEIEVKNCEGVITAEVTKQRDGRTEEKFYFSLKTITIGQDVDGEQITSCVLDCTETPPKTKRKLSGQMKRAYEHLLDLMIAKGEMHIPKLGMPKIKVVKVADFREVLEKGKIVDSDKSDNIRRSVSRVIDALNNAGITAVWGDYIWLVDQADNDGRTR